MLQNRYLYFAYLHFSSCARRVCIHFSKPFLVIVTIPVVSTANERFSESYQLIIENVHRSLYVNALIMLALFSCSLFFCAKSISQVSSLPQLDRALQDFQVHWQSFDCVKRITSFFYKQMVAGREPYSTGQRVW